MQYQIEGVMWLQRQYQTSANCILADAAGLGKTLQLVTFLRCSLLEQSDAAVAAAAAARASPSNAQQLQQQQHQQQQQQYKPALIVVPDADIAKWEHQLALYLPDVNTVSYTGCARSRELVLLYELLYATDAAATTTAAAVSANNSSSSSSSSGSANAELIAAVTSANRLKCHILLTSHSVAKSDAPLLQGLQWGQLIVVVPPAQSSTTATACDSETSVLAAVAKQFTVVQAPHKVLAVTPALQADPQQPQQLQQQQPQLLGYISGSVSKHVLTFLGQYSAAAAAVALEAAVADAAAARVDTTTEAAAAVAAIADTQQNLQRVQQQCTLARTDSTLHSSSVSAVPWQCVRRCELLVRVALTAEQQRAYRGILVQNSAVLAGSESSSVGARTVAVQLIHACAHPAAVAGSNSSSSRSGSSAAEAFALDDAQQQQQQLQLQNGNSSSNSSSSSSASSGGKLQLVQSMLTRLLASKGDRVLLFSQFPDM
jgi:SNF2-related domain